MEFPFPPLPPGYTRVLVVRWMLLVWTLVAFGWLVYRVRRWQSIKATDFSIWVVVAIVGGLLTPFGFGSFQSNEWLVPLGVGVQAVAVSGTVATILKLWPIGGLRFLISVGIVLVVAVLLQPAETSSRTAAKRTQCKNNLKQIGLAMHNYHDEFGAFPPATGGEPLVSWRVSILPYIDQAPLFAEYDQSSAWDVAPNDKVARVLSNYLYRCPSNSMPQDAQGRWFTAYSMPTGPRTMGASPTGTTIKNIIDGTSNTLLIVEACGAQIVWTEPRDVDVASQPTGINLKGAKPGRSAGWLSSYHSGGTQALLADGAVKFISAKTDPALLKKLATVDGGEEVGDY